MLPADTGAGTASFTYDTVQRLLTAAQPTLPTLTYGYDAAHNRTSVSGGTAPRGATSFAYLANEALNTETPTGQSTLAYSPDADGNITADAVGHQVKYDSLNRLQEARDSTGASVLASYVYDAVGRLTKRTAGTAITQFFYRGLEDKVVQEQDGSYTVLRSYAWDLNGRRLSVQTGGSLYTVATNPHGDVVGLMTGTGSVVGWAHYDPWGQLLGTSGTTIPFGFQGGFTDPLANYGFVRMGVRWYDPREGRFVTKDPVAGGNRWIYGLDGPMSYVDRSGLCADWGDGGGHQKPAPVSDLRCMFCDLKPGPRGPPLSLPSASRQGAPAPGTVAKHWLQSVFSHRMPFALPIPTSEGGVELAFVPGSVCGFVQGGLCPQDNPSPAEVIAETNADIQVVATAIARSPFIRAEIAAARRDPVGTALTLGSLALSPVPVLGSSVSLVNAGYHVYRHDYVGAGFALVGAVPGVGYLGAAIRTGGEVERLAADTAVVATDAAQAERLTGQLLGDAGPAAGDTVNVSRVTDAGPGNARISLDAARAAAERNGIDTRSFDLNYESAGPGQYGFTSYNGAGRLIRGATGRFQVTLTDLGLRSEEDAVNTIAHELNHIRESMATGTFPEGEDPATAAGDIAEWFFR